MAYGEFSEEFLKETMVVRLSKRDILLIQGALEFLLQSSTREEHNFEDIHDLLERLPRVRERLAA